MITTGRERNSVTEDTYHIFMPCNLIGDDSLFPLAVCRISFRSIIYMHSLSWCWPESHHWCLCLQVTEFAHGYVTKRISNRIHKYSREVVHLDTNETIWSTHKAEHYLPSSHKLARISSNLSCFWFPPEPGSAQNKLWVQDNILWRGNWSAPQLKNKQFHTFKQLKYILLSTVHG